MSYGLFLMTSAGILALTTGLVTDLLARRRGAPGRFVWVAVLIGGGAFLLSGFAQSLLVSPVAIALHGARGIRALVPRFAGEALYYGLAAGIAQEGIKALFLYLYGRGRPSAVPFAAIAMGSGFALFEIVYLSLPALHLSLASAPVGLAVWERWSATLFHIGALMWIAAGLLRGRAWPYILAAVLMHAAADGTVGLLQMAHTAPGVAYEAANFAFSALIWLTGLLLLRSGIHEGRTAADA